MPSEQDQATPGMPQEITDALGSVWKQYVGKRPSSTETQIRGNIVRCVLDDSVSEFDSGLSAAAGADAQPARPLTRSTYRRDAIAAVSRATKRRVLAFVSNPNPKTDVATEVFILDGPPRRG